MELEYESTLKDACRPQIRHFIGSETYKKQLIAGCLWSGFFAALFVCAISKLIFGEVNIYYVALGLVLGIVTVALTHKDSVTKRITKHMDREIGDKFPYTTTYLLDDESLTCRSLDTDITFKLMHCSDISEVDGYLEVRFGGRGLCTIPLRAFTTEFQKSSFIDAIKIQAEQVAAPDS
ncbi:hypothetical protein HW115_19365 [Verrucomicrobiaceae bacterium N1E253]|uniref:YcxB-like protein domain-containing protein n=1 Tax=Oceaniferula marina TaxID=2748318 RepID=A0A851GRX7_9BACT|nr:hypothetical protein [Oceaniferula marina]NWK57787.1 hypothetical protein [Oceaniferula marina]